VCTTSGAVSVGLSTCRQVLSYKAGGGTGCSFAALTLPNANKTALSGGAWGLFGLTTSVLVQWQRSQQQSSYTPTVMIKSMPPRMGCLGITDVKTTNLTAHSGVPNGSYCWGWHGCGCSRSLGCIGEKQAGKRCGLLRPTRGIQCGLLEQTALVCKTRPCARRVETTLPSTYKKEEAY
jgi:hypothetical protein